MANILYEPILENMSKMERRLYLIRIAPYFDISCVRKAVYDMTLYQYYKKEMKSGDRVYVNAISCTTRDVNTLRKLVQTGGLKPDETLLRKCVIESAVPAFMDGTCIFPQMDYIKQ